MGLIMSWAKPRTSLQGITNPRLWSWGKCWKVSFNWKMEHVAEDIDGDSDTADTLGQLPFCTAFSFNRSLSSQLCRMSCATCFDCGYPAAAQNFSSTSERILEWCKHQTAAWYPALPELLIVTSLAMQLRGMAKHDEMPQMENEERTSRTWL